MNAPGWRRNPSAPAADPALLEALRGLATSLLSDNMARLAGTVGLTPVSPAASRWPAPR